MTPRTHRLRYTSQFLAGSLGCIALIFLLALGRSGRLDIKSQDQPDGPFPSSSIPTNMLSQQAAFLSRGENVPLHDIHTICFYRDGSVYIYDLDKKEARRIVEGSNPDISPLGSAIAFTDGKPLPDGNHRTIKAFDLKTNEIIEFPSLAGIYSYNPKWSHDGEKIAFNLVSGKRAHVGLLNVESGDFENLSRSLHAEHLRFDSWTEGDKSIVCHDLENIYEIAVDGSLLQTIPIRTLIHESKISSSTKFSFSRGRQYLLFDGNGEGGNAVIYAYDFQSGKLLTITPETMEAREPIWSASGEDVMFSCLVEHQKGMNYDLCVKSINSDEIKIIIGDASAASYSIK